MKRPHVSCLSQENMEAYADGGGHYVWPLVTAHKLQLEIDIPNGQLVLTGPWDESDVEVAPMANCSFAVGQTAEAQPKYFRLAVQNVTEWFVFYQFMEMIARYLVDGVTLAQAFSDAVKQWSALLASRSKMSTEREVGLFGELLFLESLIEAQPLDFDLQVWTGPESEEHDFKFEAFDVEVKTTTAESRSHKIGTLTQLAATPGKGLFLLSIQVTRSGNNARTLSELIDRIRTMLPHTMHEKFEDFLLKSAYQEAGRDLLSTSWGLRTSPHFYIVDASFPKLTEDNIHVSNQQRPLISDISYRINVSTLEPTVAEFANFTKGRI